MRLQRRSTPIGVLELVCLPVRSAALLVAAASDGGLTAAYVCSRDYFSLYE